MLNRHAILVYLLGLNHLNDEFFPTGSSVASKSFERGRMLAAAQT